MFTDASEARFRPFDQASSLLLRDPRKDGEHRVTDGAARVQPWLAHGHELYARPIQREHVRQVSGHASAESVKAPNRDDVEEPSLRALHPLFEHWAAFPGARRLFKRGQYDESASVREAFQLGLLIVWRLSVRANAHVESHALPGAVGGRHPFPDVRSASVRPHSSSRASWSAFR
jgi:hypothetical protein